MIRKWTVHREIQGHETSSYIDIAVIVTRVLLWRDIIPSVLIQVSRHVFWSTLLDCSNETSEVLKLKAIENPELLHSVKTILRWM